MIKNFACKETGKIFNRQVSRKLLGDIQSVVRRKLEGVELLMDLRIPPNNQLEKLSKDRNGQCSIRINKQWRICFEWHERDAYSVEIVDYH
ncbi:MAG: type II toxin-antitoxin system RelE/ParE family toxin [Candidatus Anammoxibacter sp.]